MAAVSCALYEEQFLCSICLEVFSAPVTTPCGHSFCSACINQHWNTSDICNCPVCKQVFSTKPNLKVNVVLAEMVFEYRSNPKNEDVEEGRVILEPQSAAEAMVGGTSEAVCDISAVPKEVVCDLCPEPKLQALKSCLVCVASYCQSHLQPHLTNPHLKRHQLIEAQSNLEERICSDHNRPLELFCKDHSHFICLDCTSAGHKDHKYVPLKEECEGQQTEVKEQIKDRLVKIEEIRGLVELSKKNSDTEIQEGVKVFNTVMGYVQQSMDMFKQNLEEKHKNKEEAAAQLVNQIQEEISVLEQRGAEMEQLWSSGDHLHFLQTFTSAKPAPQLKDWKISKSCTIYHGNFAETLTKMKDDQFNPEIKKVFMADLKRFQRYEVHVTLDDDTCHPNIRLERGSKKAQYTSTKENYSDHPKRFSSNHFVLGRQAFSSGKFYFEVSVKGSRQWAVGVASESVRRKGDITPKTWSGFYLLEWDNQASAPCTAGGSYMYLECMPWDIGVFVDYEGGLVSFFDVNKGVLITSLTYWSFTGNLLPLISLGDRFGAMQITPVCHSC